MKDKYFLIIDSEEYQLQIDEKAEINNDILSHVPIRGEAKNIEGEIFYMVDIDISFNGREKEVFNIGDIVYWRSEKSRKFAIAIFYGNTKFGMGNAPRAASPCIKFASIIGDFSNLKSVSSGTRIEIIIKN